METKTLYSAVDIANIFIEKGKNDGIPLTQMKLQKMVYFAYGLLLAYSKGEEKLFNESIQAWKFGPVIPKLYEEFKYYGAGDITKDNGFYTMVFGKPKKAIIPITNEKHQLVIDSTWKFLKDISALQLSNWTHKEGSAWHKVFTPYDNSIPINDTDIIEDFKRFLKEE